MNNNSLVVALLDKHSLYEYIIYNIAWDDTNDANVINKYTINKEDLISIKKEKRIHILNAKIKRNNAGDYDISFLKHKNKREFLKFVVGKLRSLFEQYYGTGEDLCGYCIQASETLKTILNCVGIKSRTVDGWYEYDGYCYESHRWLEVDKEDGGVIYVDITADQFNATINPEERFNGTIIQLGLPHGIVYNKHNIY